MKKIKNNLTAINLMVLIVIINVILALLPLPKIDLTNDKVHSLSASSKEVIRNLDDIVKVKVYESKELPAEVKQVADSLNSITKEFARLNKSKFLVEFIDPSESNELKAEAVSEGIQTLQFSTVKNEKLEVSNGYLGMTISFGDKKEVLPVAGDVGNVEYFIVSSIKKLTATELPKIVLIDGTMTNKESRINIFEQYLSSGYRVVNLEVGSTAKIEDDVKTVVLVGVNQELKKELVDSIGEFVRKGGALVYLDSPIKVSDNLEASTIRTGLEGLLSENGIEIKNALVLDSSSAIASFRNNNESYLTQYPYWITVLSENVNRDTAMTSNISSPMLPWTSPIETGEGVKAIVLSSNKAISMDNLANIRPDSKANMQGKEFGQYNLAVLKTDGAKIGVIASNYLLDDQFLSNNQENLALALNMVDYLSNDETLLSIRSKSISSNPLRPIDDWVKQVVKWVNLGLPIVILLTIGLVVRIWRIKKNRKYEIK